MNINIALKHGLTSIILLIVIVSSAYSIPDNKKVLIINSYHQGYPWSDTLMHNIEKMLCASDIDITIYKEFLDTKRRGWAPSIQKSYAQYLESLYPKGMLDLVIVMDNNAYDFALSGQIKSIKGLPTVFCGVNDFNPDDIKKHHNFTGIAEAYDMAANIDFAQSIFKTVNTVHFIVANTPTGKNYLNNAKKQLADFKMNYIDGANYSTKELLTYLKKLPKGDIVLATTWTRDKNNKFYKWEKISTEISSISNVPVFEIISPGDEDKTLGGIIISASTHGEITAQMAYDILTGTPVNKIPVNTNSYNNSTINWAYLEHRWGDLLLDKEKIDINDTKNKSMQGLELKIPITNISTTHILDKDKHPLDFGRDLLNHIARKYNWKTTTVEMPWNKTRQALQDGIIDIIPVTGNMPGKDILLDFTEIAIYDVKCYLVTEQSNGINSLNQLNGKKIGFIDTFGINSTFYSNAHKNNLHYKKAFYPSFDELLKALDAGKIDAALIVETEENNPYFKSSFIAIPTSQYSYAVKMAVKKGTNKQLLKIIDTQISEWKKDINSPYYQLLRKHFSEPESAEWKPINLTEEEQAWLDSVKTLRVYYRQMEPFFILDKGRYTGFCADYMEIIANKLDVELDITTYEEISYETALAASNDVDRFHILPAMTTRRINDANYSFSKTYMTAPRVLITRENNENILCLADLEGKTLAIIEGVLYGQVIAEQYPSIKILAVRTREEGFYAVISGRADALITLLPISLWHLSNNDYPSLKITSAVGKPTEMFMGIGDSDPILESIINKVIRATPKTLLHDLEQKYIKIEYDSGISLVQKQQYIIAILLLIAIFIVAFYLRTRRSRAIIREHREQLRITLQSIGDAVISTDINGNVVQMNHVAENLTGWTTEDATGEPLDDVFIIVNALTNEKAENPVNKVLENGQIVGLANHTKLLAKDGKEYQIADSAAPIKSEDDNIIGVVLVFRDVTEEYRIQEELQESEEKFRALFDKNIDYVMIFDPVLDSYNILQDATLVEINAQYLNWLGMKHEDVIDRTIRDIWAQTQQSWFDKFNEVVQTGQATVFEKYHVPTRVYIRTSLFLIDEKTRRFCMSFSDITAETIAKQEIQESEERLQITLNSIGDAVISTDTSGNIIQMNPIAETLTGWKIEEALGKPLDDVFIIVNALTNKKAENPVNKVLENGQIVGLANHTKLLAKDGKEYQIADSAAPIKSEDDNIIGVVLVFRDVTEEYRMQEELRASEEKFRLAFRTSPDSISISKLHDGIYVEINEGFTKTMGYTREDVLGVSSLKIDIWKKPEDRKTLTRALQAHGYVENLEAQFIAKDGSIKDGLMSARIVVINGVKTILSIARDITDRKKAEIALQESEERFKALHNASFGGIAIHEHGIILECNHGLSEITGYSFDELIGMNGLLLISEKTRDLVINKIETGYEEPYEAIGARKNGSEYSLRIEARNVPYKGKEVRTVEFRDITEQKQAEKAIKASEEKFRNLIKHSSDWIAIIDTNANVTYTSPAVEKILGFEASTVINANAFDCIHKNDKLLASDLFDSLLNRETDTIKMALRLKHKDGTYRWLEAIATNLTNTQPVNGIVINARDITERKLNEESIRTNEQNLKLVGKIARVGYFEIDLQTNKTIWNEEGCAVFGISKNNNIATAQINQMTHQDDIESLNDWLEHSSKSDIIDYSNSFTYRINKPDEGIRWIKVNLITVRNENGTPIKSRGFVQDITEERIRQEELAIAKEKADVANRSQSIFIANMSHEIRTPLNAILGFGELIERTSTESRTARYIKSIRTAGNSLLSLINDILEFSRLRAGKFELRPKPVDIADVAEELHTIFWQRAETKSLDFEINHKDSLPLIMLDMPTLRQVMINLIGNAIKFTELGSVIVTIELENFTEDYVDIIFKVTDTGLGIDKADLDTIFDEFQQGATGRTHKYEGTGLGLFLSRNFAALMNGVIAVESQVGKGSTFTLKIKKAALVKNVIASKKEKKRVEEHATQTYKFNNETVLIVGDTPNNREVLTNQLAHVNLSPIALASGKIALNKLKAIKPVLFILDLYMDNMNGDELALEIRKIKGYEKATIFCTTASISPESTYNLEVFNHVLSKPIVSDILFSRIAEFLPHTTTVTTPGKPTKHSNSKVTQIKNWQNKQDFIKQFKDNILLLSQGFTEQEIQTLTENLLAFAIETKNDELKKLTQQLITANNYFNIREIKQTINYLVKELKDE